MLNRIRILSILLATVGVILPSAAQQKIDRELSTAIQSAVTSGQRHEFEKVIKKLDDLLLYEGVGDVAFIDKVRLAGPPKAVRKPTGVPFQDELLDNDLIFYSYVIIPKTTKQNRKYPLIVLVHGGIHGNFSSVFTHFIRELVAQGYIIVAPDYRGSTGYGKGFFQAIDYGGLENEDVLAACRYMTENYSIVDKDRVGLLGWSHGGMITLMNACRYPDVFTCGYAGVPVSDVAYRLSYKSPGYTNNFTPSYHVGKTPQQDPAEYARRSPVSYAKDLKIPLMITTTVNDDDVSYKEVKRMIDSLNHYGKEFEYKIYDRTAGAHLFERIDIKEATDIRYNAYKFLERHLNPPKPLRSIRDMRKAGYRYY